MEFTTLLKAVYILTVSIVSFVYFSTVSFLFTKKTLRLNNLKTRPATNAKISVFVSVEAIIYLLSYNLHDCTFNYAAALRS